MCLICQNNDKIESDAQNDTIREVKRHNRITCGDTEYIKIITARIVLKNVLISKNSDLLWAI